MTTSTRLNILDVQREICRRSLLDFLEHVWIPDPPPAGVGTIKFIKWPHILRLHEAVEAIPPGGVLPNLKARKVGVTSYFEARFVHSAQFHPGSVLPVISQGELEAKKVIADCKFIWEHLPDHLRSDLVLDNTEALKFKDGGIIQSFPATAKAGRSFTGTEILFDEADFHAEFEASYNALLPLIQDTGGKLFAVSTANPDKVDSAFRQLYRKSPYRLFLGYYDRPGRTQESFRAAEELATDPARFEKENPRTETEALAPPTSRMYFDREALTDLQAYCETPTEVLNGGLVRIWRKPIMKGKYLAFGDVAWGEKGAYSCVTIADWQDFNQVAEIYGRPDLGELSRVTWKLCQIYNAAYLGIEANGEGITVVNNLVEVGYGHRMYHRRDNWRHVERDRGWYTLGGPGQSRDTMLGELEEAIRARVVRPKCKDTIQELMSFVRNDGGKLGPAEGAYADHVMSWAGLVQMKKYSRYNVSTGKPVTVGRRF